MILIIVIVFLGDFDGDLSILQKSEDTDEVLKKSFAETFVVRRSISSLASTGHVSQLTEYPCLQRSELGRVLVRIYRVPIIFFVFSIKKN